MSSKTMIGWQESVRLPQLFDEPIKVKIDTGAKTSALHATHIKLIEKDEKKYVSFRVHNHQCLAPWVDTRVVSNSGGSKEKRHVIRTSIAMTNFQWNIEITLTNRNLMRFPMLLGRAALKGRFIIEPNKRFMLGKL